MWLELRNLEQNGAWAKSNGNLTPDEHSGIGTWSDGLDIGFEDVCSVGCGCRRF